MKTILVLDDQKIVTIRLKSALGKKYKVLTANTFDEAEFYIKKETIHLAIIDICLKGDDRTGLDFLKLLIGCFIL